MQTVKCLRTSVLYICEYWKSLIDRGINLGNKETPANLYSYHLFSTAHLPHDLYCVVSYPLITIVCKVLHKVLHYPSQLLYNTEVPVIFTNITMLRLYWHFTCMLFFIRNIVYSFLSANYYDK